MTRFLRFVKRAHFFAFAFACVFGVFATTNAWAYTAEQCAAQGKRLSGTSCVACASGEYVVLYNNNTQSKCVTCPNYTYKDVATSYAHDYYLAPRQCGNGYYYCPYNGYRVFTSYNGEHYECWPCPRVEISHSVDSHIANYSTSYYGVFSGNEWSQTQRCRFTTSDRTDSNNCTYNIVVTPTDTGDYKGFTSQESPDIYATDILNAYTTLNGTAPYTYTIKYKSCPAAYGVTSNNTTSASSAHCASGKYSPAGSVSCANPPSYATVSSDQSDFLCNKGYYRHYGQCLVCPLYIPDNPGSNPDPSNWSVTTTAGAGATSVVECYAAMSDSDTTGTYDTGMCTLEDSACNGWGCSVFAIRIGVECMQSSYLSFVMEYVCQQFVGNNPTNECLSALAADYSADSETDGEFTFYFIDGEDGGSGNYFRGSSIWPQQIKTMLQELHGSQHNQGLCWATYLTYQVGDNH